MRRLARPARVSLDRMQTNYLCNVLRLPQDASILVFNGRDGEWLCALDRSAKKSAQLVAARARARTDTAERSALSVRPAQTYAARLHGAESGRARRFEAAAVITRHTQATRVNLERMRANAIEAAEQCGILSIPESSSRRLSISVDGARRGSRSDFLR